ncbi:hypothetical protein I6M42_21955 [Shewanella algae]|uniref:hypothetical protein n=1 Tax=Shewanella algae TaxID=38313 RepID=UPI001AAFC093|nr:hypothetical protein [Shewanella algae]MBO2639295.1 hypothetical protein [Shewanella algae]
MSNDKIADLKAKFVAGAIPLESDYAKLLDMLEETRAATGTSPDAQKSASLRLSDEGYLDVAVAADGGIVTGASGLRTDARVLWARNHAISTGAVQYGIWTDGYVFIYNQSGTAGLKVQFCVERGSIITNQKLYLLDRQEKLLYETYDALTHEAIPGWIERSTANESHNTIQTNASVTDAARIMFVWGTTDEKESKYYSEVVAVLHSVY